MRVVHTSIAFLTAVFLLVSHTTVAQLQANFTTDKAGGCSPIAISFTNASKGASANAIYKWDFGNGNTAASVNAGAVYSEEKNYTVTLTVQDGGQTSVKTQTVSVYSRPIINDITVSPVKGCLPLNANFTATANAGSGNISSYFWDFGDGNTQQGYSPSQQHNYTVPQKATLSLTVSNNFGCTATLQKKELVEVLPAIQAIFSASQTILCRETDAVQFTNSSYGPGTLSYNWNFGDGSTSTDKTPSHVFNKKGIYTVTLTVTSSEGCVISSTQAGYINVASFSTDIQAPALVCKGSGVTFNSNSSPQTSNAVWEIDGVAYYYYYYSSLNYTFNTIGPHTVKLRNIFGTCPDSAMKTVVVKDIPNPNGFYDTLLTTCGAPTVVNFKDTTAGAVKWAWNFNAYYNSANTDAVTQAPTHTFMNDGTQYVSLTVTNADGCSVSTGRFIYITRPNVSIAYTGNKISCGPTKISYKANSTEDITAYNWRFSDGGSSTEANPERLFSNPGTYSTTLTYTTKSGCTGTVSDGDVQIYSKPVADFTTAVTTICGNTPVSFSAVPQAGNTYYSWNFGDNTGSVSSYNSSIGTHQYNYDSTYSVTLIVSNQGNCRDTMTKKNYITILPPFPKITGAVNTCDATRGLVSFTQASKKANSWIWDFGDGSAAVTLNTDQPGITHLYTKTGTYKTVLTTTNGQCSVRDSIVNYVLLKQNPVFSIASNEICAGQNFDFQINNLEPSPALVGAYNYYFVKWQYNDGNTFNGSYYVNNYYNYWTVNAAGTANSYSNTNTNIRVIFRSSYFGCEDTTNYVPLKFRGSKAGFEVVADKQCWRQPVVFRDTSKANGSSTITRWDWYFGDGNSKSFTTGGNTISHQYAGPGTYTVTLNVTDVAGCSSPAFSKQVEVYGPKAAFYPSPSNTTTITLPVYFNNNTNNYNSSGTPYKWDFGDGSTSADITPIHTYVNPGSYTVQLIAINPVTLCGDTVYQQIKVLNFAPAFTLSAAAVTGKCPPVLVRFSNNSVNYTRVTWDFGDGITADNLNYPGHVYEKPGKYIVTLYVYGVSGLKATYTDSVLVKQPMATLRTDTSDICIDGKAGLHASVSNTLSYLWDFGDGTVIPTTDSMAAHVYKTAGVYKPAIVVNDANGCSALAPLPGNINVHPNPVIAFAPAQPIVCKGSNLQINASGGSVFEWTPATGLDNPAIASPYASPAVNTDYTVAVKDVIGCSNTAVVKVIVGQPFTLKVPADTLVCFGKSLVLPVSGANTYNWINNTTGLSNTQSAAPLAAPLVSTQYTVTGKDQYNCFTQTATILVKVAPLPLVNAGPDLEAQPGIPVQLSVTTDNDVLQWNWSPASYLNCTACVSPISNPLAPINYIVSVKNKNGCIASDTIFVKVPCDESKVRIPNAFTPNGDGSNDVFMIKGIPIVMHLVIFDRWGAKVFERSNFVAGDRSSCWNGTYKGNPATAGSYVYYAEMQCPSGGVFTAKGSVVLIR